MAEKRLRGLRSAALWRLGRGGRPCDPSNRQTKASPQRVDVNALSLHTVHCTLQSESPLLSWTTAYFYTSCMSTCRKPSDSIGRSRLLAAVEAAEKCMRAVAAQQLSERSSTAPSRKVVSSAETKASTSPPA
jgi:hypothetical protein